MSQNSEQLQVREVAGTEVYQVAEVEAKAFKETLFSLLGADFIAKYYAWQIPRAPVSILLGAWIDTRMAGFCYGGVFPSSLRDFYRAHFRDAVACFAVHPWRLASPIIWRRVFWNLAERFAGAGRGLQGATPVPETFCIGRVATHPEFQRRGVARTLLAAMEARVLQLGRSSMYLYVNGKNIPAVSCYESMGWRMASAYRHNVTMVKDLSPSKRRLNRSSLERLTPEAS